MKRKHLIPRQYRIVLGVTLWTLRKVRKHRARKRAKLES